MPAKFCSFCGDEFWDRWRNTPDICAECLLRAAARVCPQCLVAHSIERDPAQLDAFGDVARPLPVRTDPDRYFRPAHRDNAPRATRLKNPYH